MDEDNDVFEEREKYLCIERFYGIFNDYRKGTFDDFLVTNAATICNGCSQVKGVQQFKISGVKTSSYNWRIWVFDRR